MPATQCTRRRTPETAHTITQPNDDEHSSKRPSSMRPSSKPVPSYGTFVGPSSLEAPLLETTQAAISLSACYQTAFPGTNCLPPRACRTYTYMYARILEYDIFMLPNIGHRLRTASVPTGAGPRRFPRQRLAHSQAVSALRVPAGLGDRHLNGLTISIQDLW